MEYERKKSVKSKRLIKVVCLSGRKNKPSIKFSVLFWKQKRNNTIYLKEAVAVKIISTANIRHAVINKTEKKG